MIPPPADVGRGRGVATGRRVVAELAVVVPTPALEEHDAREVRARVAPAGIQHLDGAIRDDRGRGVAIGRRAVAELAAAVVAPALEERAGRQVRARVAPAERQHPNGAADTDRGRGAAIGRRAVAELAESIVAPALEELADRYARVGVSEGQYLDGAAEVDRGRGVAIGRRAVAELAAAVVAPALEERAGRQVRARVGASERQHPNGAADVDRGRRVAIGIRAVAELAVFVPAPALEERAGREICARVVISEGQYPDGATEVDRGRGVAIGIRAVAELASVVSAPALKCGIGLHAPVRARVGVSECQHPDDGATRVDCGRGAATGRRAVAELACAVRAPALEKCAGREVRA